ncbi:hypothetical protein JRO89_XS10G0135900 [Xanthoceras sorbifolium]|uniref:C2H2-type domain-containing protein n=1 Tax=Xanthoceras sorbifolium TaxID=99658 RepID=A0ABQ8HIN5_9ROSI|nr:hypothetical protein JRO89_XS10G0135900 [Xanthoceras sorbifolium]
MKRGREDSEVSAMANCLMLLSKVGETTTTSLSSTTTDLTKRVFACKTCNKEFPSFQALGGHRASHKKPKLIGGAVEVFDEPESPKKPKTHECSICGVEFAIGQALGGHMRRHRAVLGGGGVLVTLRTVIWSDLNLNPKSNGFESFRVRSDPLEIIDGDGE